MTEFRRVLFRSVQDIQATAFAQTGRNQGQAQSSNGGDDWKKKAKCHHCSKKGHIHPECPKLKNNEGNDDDDEQSNTPPQSEKSSFGKKSKKKSKRVTLAQTNTPDNDSNDDDSVDYNFCNIKRTGRKGINLKDSILLNNQSTMDLFCNKRLASFIWTVANHMTVHGNDRSLTTNCMAHVNNYGNVWFNDQAITNVLSLKLVQEKFNVTYDGQNNHSVFTVHKPDGKQVHFVMHPNGLHYHNTREWNLMLVSTVKQNEEGYTPCQVASAKAAQELQATVGYPSTHNLKAILNSN